MGVIEIDIERLTLKKLGIADKEHYLNKGGVGPQNGYQALHISSHQLTRVRYFEG